VSYGDTAMPNGERPLRVLMVAPTSFFNDYGGHIRILEETRTLQRLGHQVSIVTYYKGNEVPGLDIRRTPALPWRADYDVGSSRHKLAFDVALLATCLWHGIKIKPDIVHGHMHEGALIGSVLAGLLRVPLIMDFQGSLSGEMVDHGFLNPQGLFFRLVSRLEKFICHLPTGILTSSLQARKLLVDRFDVKPEKIHPLPDCVDTNSFDPGRFSQEEKRSLRTKLGIPNERPIVAYLGLLAEYQGTSHLIEAAAELKQAGKEAHFLIMGYPGQDHYKILAEQLGVSDRVTVTGRIAYPDAPLHLSIGTVAVSPKMSSTEGSGKVLNYMAMGLPTIVYDSPVHREYLADLGLYVSSGNVTELGEKITETIERSDLQEDLGVKLRQRVAQDYSWTKAGKTIVQLYRSMMDPED